MLIDSNKPVFPIVKNDAGEFITQTPEAVHPAQIKGDSPASKAAQQSFVSISGTLARLNGMRVRCASDYKQVHGGSMGEMNMQINLAENAIKDELERYEASLVSKANFKPDPTLREVVIMSFQNMKPEERASAIDRLIEQRDGTTLAILSGVSNVFTMISDEQRAMIKPRAFKKVDPYGFAMWDQAKQNAEKVNEARLAYVNAYFALGVGADKFELAEPTPAKSVASGFSN